MPKSRGRKPKKKRALASAPKKRLDNLSATPQELPLSTQPPQEPPPLVDGCRFRKLHPRDKQEVHGAGRRRRSAQNKRLNRRDSLVCVCLRCARARSRVKSGDRREKWNAFRNATPNVIAAKQATSVIPDIGHPDRVHAGWGADRCRLGHESGETRRQRHRHFKPVE
jgi:hypothetical protein